MVVARPKKTPDPLFVMPRLRVGLICLSVLIPLEVGVQEDPAPPPGSARELLSRYDIGPAQFSLLVDGAPLKGGEEEVLAKILLRLPRLGPDNIHRWRKSG